MSDLRQQFGKIQDLYHGLVTPISLGRIWEISLPDLLKTKFTQTSLILEKRTRFYCLHDNGSCNNGVVFHLSSHDQYIKSRLMMKYHIQLIIHRYYEVLFLKNQPNGTIKNVRNLMHFLIKLDRMFKTKI